MSESKANKAIREELAERMKVTAKKIQDVLEADGFALQPFLVRSEYGDSPQVRLVDTSNIETNDGQETNTGEAEGDKVESESTEAKSA